MTRPLRAFYLADDRFCEVTQFRAILPVSAIQRDVVATGGVLFPCVDQWMQVVWGPSPQAAKHLRPQVAERDIVVGAGWREQFELALIHSLFVVIGWGIIQRHERVAVLVPQRGLYQRLNRRSQVSHERGHVSYIRQTRVSPVLARLQPYENRRECLAHHICTRLRGQWHAGYLAVRVAYELPILLLRKLIEKLLDSSVNPRPLRDIGYFHELMFDGFFLYQI